MASDRRVRDSDCKGRQFCQEPLAKHCQPCRHTPLSQELQLSRMAAKALIRQVGASLHKSNSFTVMRFIAMEPVEISRVILWCSAPL